MSDERITIPNRGEMQLHLNIGCGNNIKTGKNGIKWINVDARLEPGVDYKVDARKLPFDNDVFSLVYACHLLEHFSIADSKPTVKEWSRVLKKNGSMFIAVPNVLKIGEDFFKAYIGRDSVMKYLYGGQSYSYNFHKSGYCSSTLREVMESSGIHKIKQWVGHPDDASNSTYSLNLVGVKK